MQENNMNKLNVKALTIALGCTWAISMLILGWAAIFGFYTNFVEIIASAYIGFAPTFIGGIIGAIWGFFDGAIGGFLIAIIYNGVLKWK